jgi:hypothetical protein
MARETVFYFDVLGFRQLASGVAGAVDALSDLATLLQHDRLFPGARKWSHRYALSDSVFLTHPDPTTAIEHASDLIFNLFQLTRHRPILIRGGIAYGQVRHLKGIFLATRAPANLVGPAVVDAVMLEQSSGLKGPRILLSERLAQTAAAALREWLLRPTSAPGVWEVLWLLPSRPSEVADYEREMVNICKTALELFPLGGHPTAGAHYREFLMLVARALERLRQFTRDRRTQVSRPFAELLPAARVRSVLSATSGVPDDYASSLLALVDSLNAT